MSPFCETTSRSGPPTPSSPRTRLERSLRRIFRQDAEKNAAVVFLLIPVRVRNRLPLTIPVALPFRLDLPYARNELGIQVLGRRCEKRPSRSGTEYAATVPMTRGNVRWRRPAAGSDSLGPSASTGMVPPGFGSVFRGVGTGRPEEEPSAVGEGHVATVRAPRCVVPGLVAVDHQLRAIG